MNGTPQAEENGNEKVGSHKNQVLLSQILSNSSATSFHDHAYGANGSIPVRKTHKCCVYIPTSSKYCARLFSIQAYSDINRDVSLLYCLNSLLIFFCCIGSLDFIIFF